MKKYSEKEFISKNKKNYKINMVVESIIEIDSNKNIVDEVKKIYDKAEIISVEESSKKNESFHYGINSNYEYSIGIYSHSNLEYQFWKMIKNGSEDVLKAISSKEGLNVELPYLFRYCSDSPICQPIDLNNICRRI